MRGAVWVVGLAFLLAGYATSLATAQATAAGTWPSEVGPPIFRLIIPGWSNPPARSAVVASTAELMPGGPASDPPATAVESGRAPGGPGDEWVRAAPARAGAFLVRHEGAWQVRIAAPPVMPAEPRQLELPDNWLAGGAVGITACALLGGAGYHRRRG